MIKKKIYVKLSKNYFFLIKDTNIPYSLHFRINCCKRVTTFFFFWQISAYPKGWFPHSCTFYVNQFIGWKVNIQFVDQLKGKRKKKKKEKQKYTRMHRIWEKEIYEPSRYLDDDIEAFIRSLCSRNSFPFHTRSRPQASTNIIIRIRRNEHACFEL